ncbi:hypothetical protein [Deinococcus daejeonensis]|uniref:hypothetical protein n=1 Tax=Deinococcus daejeonensis TaxID=1007098 RepID=UPI001662BDAF|nr:hypothetical protein [Deinococcus daejeonensis]
MSIPQSDLKVNDALTRLVRFLPATSGHPLLSTFTVPVEGAPGSFSFEVGCSPDLSPDWAQSVLEAVLREAHGQVLEDLGAVHFGPVRRAGAPRPPER